ncbi:MAG: molecular chaperone [Bacteroidetes bacterium OLB9]|nr:MAG: molecular chaperone [Bacteroidetes bacterium OLB9]
MNTYLEKLYLAARADERHIIGLMSGTSLDGLDIAYCKFTGHGLKTAVEVIIFETIPYPDHVKEKNNKSFAQQEVDFAYLVLLNEWLGRYHGALVNQFIQKHQLDKASIDVIASHGQTVMHVPHHQHSYKDMLSGTLQIGDGDQIAVGTGMTTISDFRQKHIAFGGEGAPLAAYGDFLLYSHPNEHRILLNIGGIANFTLLPAGGDVSKVFVTDTGPGNKLMDGWAYYSQGMAFDQNGQLAAVGKVHTPLLSRLKRHYFFSLPFPKSTGPEVFNIDWVHAALDDIPDPLSDADIMTTLCAFTAESIADAIHNVVQQSDLHLYISGGGVHNPILMKMLSALLHDITIDTIDTISNIAADAKEAVLFALLANETICGNHWNTTQNGTLLPTTLGKISFPA